MLAPIWFFFHVLQQKLQQYGVSLDGKIYSDETKTGIILENNCTKEQQNYPSETDTETN